MRECNGRIPFDIRRTVVPGAPDAWITALEHYGTMSFGEVAASAIRYARDGFAVHTVMATFLQDKVEDYRRWPENTAIYHRNGEPLREGDRLVQADLGRTIQFMADQEKAAAGRGRDAGLMAAREEFGRLPARHALRPRSDPRRVVPDERERLSGRGLRLRAGRSRHEAQHAGSGDTW